MSKDSHPFTVALLPTEVDQIVAESASNDKLCLLAQCHGKAVRLFLQRVAGGLYVEREEIPRHGTRTCQSLHFSDHARFEQWCDEDPTRFEHPLLHARLKRESNALW
jgi:hypothetical protein